MWRQLHNSFCKQVAFQNTTQQHTRSKFSTSAQWQHEIHETRWWAGQTSLRPLCLPSMSLSTLNLSVPNAIDLRRIPIKHDRCSWCPPKHRNICHHQWTCCSAYLLSVQVPIIGYPIPKHTRRHRFNYLSRMPLLKFTPIDYKKSAWPDNRFSF